MASFGQWAGSLAAGLLDFIGLGNLFRDEVLNADRNQEKVIELNKKLADINSKYQNKIDYYQAAIEALTGSGLPIPSPAMSKIAEKRQELVNKRDKLQQNQSLVQDYGNIASRNLDTSNVNDPNDSIYERKENMNKVLKEAINAKISKDIEEEL